MFGNPLYVCWGEFGVTLRPFTKAELEEYYKLFVSMNLPCIYECDSCAFA
jgi:hypothetical protein